MFCWLDSQDEDEQIYFQYVYPGDHAQFCVGFFAPDGKFIWHTAFDKWQDADAYVSYLNGGQKP